MTNRSARQIRRAVIALSAQRSRMTPGQLDRYRTARALSRLPKDRDTAGALLRSADQAADLARAEHIADELRRELAAV